MQGERAVDSILDYWPVLVRRRWAVYLAVISVTLVALIGSFLVTPLYRSSVTMQIERQNPDIFTFRDLAQIDSAWPAYADYYQTQYKIIGSAGVARRAVERLDLTNHPDFSQDEDSTPPGLLARLRSMVPRKSVALEVDPLDVAAGRVLSGLEVLPVRDSQLVQIVWTSADPNLAAEVANAVAEAYIEFNIDSQYAATDVATEFLAVQIRGLKDEIIENEKQLQEYGAEKQILSMNDATNITLRALQDIARQRTEAQTTLARERAAHRSVLDASPEALPEVMNSGLVIRLRQEAAAYEAQLSETSRQFKADWPGMQTLQSKLDQASRRLELETERIARQVRASAEASFLKARDEVRNLEKLLADQEQAAQRLKIDAVEFVTLESEVEKKREMLDSLMRRQSEVALSGQLKNAEKTTTNVRIMERARPAAAPYRPNTRLNLLLGLILGLSLGVGLALVLEYFDNTINSAVELERTVSLPTLAIVPRSGRGIAPAGRGRRRGPVAAAAQPFDLVAHLDGRAAASEAFRELRTSILLSNPGRPPRRIMISSAFPEEGKTATAINLSVVLAQLGRQVLVVDADLRRPRLNKAFGLDRTRGVSTYLSGLEQDPAKLVVRTNVPNLDVMPSGPIPPNPSELLNSPVFAEMGDELLARGYDHIVFDSPPLLSVSDPVIIASVADTAIVVVRAGRTPRQSVRLAAEKLQQAGSASLGVVLNDLDTEAPGASYHRYRYYGRYGETELEDTPEEPRAGGASA